MKTPYDLIVEKLEALYIARSADLSLADTFAIFDAIASAKEAAKR